MSTKNAYQIRLDVLCMAERLAVDKFRQNLEFNKLIHEQNLRGVQQFVKLDNITYPTSEDITTKAKELYSFIENKENQ